jgi:hypothetical protein
MWSAFGESLNSELESRLGERNTTIENGAGESQDWRTMRKVKVVNWNENTEPKGSRCFGTKMAEEGRDCVWKLHGGI